MTARSAALTKPTRALDQGHEEALSFIAGVTLPREADGHAGALISGGADTAQAKLEIMEACGMKVTRNPSEMGRLLKSVLRT